MTKPYRRRRLFIDRPIQTALMVRAVSYCTIVMMMQVFAVTVLPALFGPSDNSEAAGERLWWTLGPAVVGSMAALPLILLDVLRLSHRWVGPIFRLRSYLRSLRDGEPVGELRFRERDFWPELADDFNEIAAELKEARALQKLLAPDAQPTLVSVGEDLT